jgi:DNA transposition AAA+ family ATPase
MSQLSVLTLQQKRDVTQAVLAWVDDKNPARSGSKLAEKAAISPSYVSQIKSGKYQIELKSDGRIIAIKDAYFVRIADAIGLRLDDTLHWDFIDNFKRVVKACNKAKKKALRMIIDTATGMGKTHALEHFAATNDYAIYVKSDRNMSGKDLLDDILHAMGVHDVIRGNHAKLKMIRHVITNRKGYIIIIDEVEQVRATINDVLKDIADIAHNKCALVISGMGIIQKFDRLANNQKPGFPQLRRRFFGNRVMLSSKLTHEEIVDVCEYEKITNKGAQNLLAQYVTDLDMLSQYVRDIKDEQEKTGKKLTAPEVAQLLEISFTSFNSKAA